MKTRAYFFSFLLAGALVLSACGKKADEAATDTTAVENKDTMSAPAQTSTETAAPAPADTSMGAAAAQTDSAATKMGTDTAK